MSSELFGNSDKLEPEEVYQKTFDSEPITTGEFDKIKNNLYMDDIFGGLHNVDLSEQDKLILAQQDKLAKESIVIDDGMETTETPQMTDGVVCIFTPADLMIIKNILEEQSINMVDIEYMSDVMEEYELYDQQSYVRQLRDKVDGYIDNYVKLRPYSPFFLNWVKKIGKKYARKM